MSYRCGRCVEDKTNCIKCRENPIYADIPTESLFKAYVPVCPRGYQDCVCDPAYILYHHTKWYKELYGNLSPKEAILVGGGCMSRVQDDPKEENYCYDDGD